MNAAAKKAVKAQYLKFLADRGTPQPTLTPAQLVEAVLEFYQSVRIEGCDPKNDGDMLLFQWGSYGEKTFSFDVTRQLIWEDDEGDQDLWQLSHVLKFPAKVAADLGEGNEWCSSPTKTSVKGFLAFIRRSEAFKALKDVPAKGHVRLERV